MPKDQGSTTHRGIGFITLASAESVDSLMVDTHELGGSTVVVDRATPKDLFDVDFDEHPQLRDIAHHYFFERFKGYRYWCHQIYQGLIEEGKDPLQHFLNQYIKSAD